MNVATDKNQFSGSNRNGSPTLKFLDSERQSVAKGLSEQQQEDAAKATGLGLTFGIMGTQEKPSDYYGKGMVKKVDNLDLPDPVDSAAKTIGREFGEGGLARRFGRPFAIAGLGSYVGSRFTNNALSEDKIYDGPPSPRPEPESLQGASGDGKTISTSTNPMQKKSFDKESAPKFIDDMMSFFGQGAKNTDSTSPSDIEFPDSEDAIEEYGRRIDSGDVDMESLSPKEMTDEIEGLKRDMQLDAAGKKVKNDPNFDPEESRSWDEFTDDSSKYAPDLGVKGTLQAAGGGAILGGAGLLGNYGYRSTQPEVKLTPQEKRVNTTAGNVMHPAGPARHGLPNNGRVGPQSGQRGVRRAGRPRKQASLDKTADEPTQSQIQGGMLAGGAGTAGLGAAGPSLIRASNPFPEANVRRLSNMAEMDPPLRGDNRAFMRDYANRGGRIMSGRALEGPLGITGVNSGTVINAAENVPEGARSYLPELIQKQLENTEQRIEGPDDPQHMHYDNFAKGPAGAVAQIQADGSTLAGGPIEDPYLDFKSDMEEIMSKAEAAEGEDRVSNLADAIQEQDADLEETGLGNRLSSKDAKQLARQMDDAFYEQGKSIDEVFPGAAEEGRSVLDVGKQNMLGQAQEMDLGVNTFEDVTSMSNSTQEAIMRNNDTQGNLYQDYGMLKNDRDFFKAPMNKRPLADGLQSATRSFDSAAQSFANKASPALMAAGAGLAAGAVPAGYAYREMQGKETDSLNDLVPGVGDSNQPKASEMPDTEEMAKESAKTKLKDLEREGDRVKYRGKWYKPDQPVESWRSGKKRAVLATKEENGEKTVRLIHYGSSDHQHNYSEDAKKNYLARSRGITDGDGNKTKDDPHSANYWSIKDLWPEDSEPDGSAKMDLEDLMETPPEKEAASQDVSSRLESAIKTAAGEGIAGSGVTAEQIDGPLGVGAGVSFAGPVVSNAAQEASRAGNLRKSVLKGTAGAIEGLGAPGRGVQTLLGKADPAPSANMPTTLPGSVESLAESYGLGKPDDYYSRLARQAQDEQPDMDRLRDVFGENAYLGGSGAMDLNVPGGSSKSDVDVTIPTENAEQTSRKFNSLMDRFSKDFEAWEHPQSQGKDIESFGQVKLPDFEERVDFRVSHNPDAHERVKQMTNVSENMSNAEKGRRIQQKRNMQQMGYGSGPVSDYMNPGDYTDFKRDLDRSLDVPVI